MERETGFEPATSTLARSHSTTELLPHTPPVDKGTIGILTPSRQAGAKHLRNEGDTRFVYQPWLDRNGIETMQSYRADYVGTALSRFPFAFPQHDRRRVGTRFD